MARNDAGDPGTWETARELGKQLAFPVGPYKPRVPTADEMNAVLPYLMDRATRHYESAYYCTNAEVAFAHLLGVNVPRQGFPRSDGYSRHNLDWEGYDKNGYDADGRNREGYNRYGFNREGYNKEGYDQYGFDREGFNKKGLDQNGLTRDEGVAKQVAGWSEEYAAAIAAYVAQLQAQQPPAEAVVEEPKKAPAKKVTAKKVVIKRDFIAVT